MMSGKGERTGATVERCGPVRAAALESTCPGQARALLPPLLFRLIRRGAA